MQIRRFSTRTRTARPEAFDAGLLRSEEIADLAARTSAFPSLKSEQRSQVSEAYAEYLNAEGYEYGGYFGIEQREFRGSDVSFIYIGTYSGHMLSWVDAGFLYAGAVCQIEVANYTIFIEAVRNRCFSRTASSGAFPRPGTGLLSREDVGDTRKRLNGDL